MTCEQELCPFWSGSGCVCDVVDIPVTDRNLARNATEGWAAYAAEQERHAETTARLEAMTREARLSREATEKAVRRLERLRDGVAYLHDVYATAPNEPRCCSDCAANDISPELRKLLADARA